jgi:methylated-DNA-[protein]-cysteine S-methyltransferase
MRMLTETDAPMCYSLFETSIGQVGVAWSGRGLTRLQLPEASAAATERRLRGRSHTVAQSEPPAPVRRAIASIQKYLAGEETDFAQLELDLTGVSSFHRRIYGAARCVGWGETTTYGALARQAGLPGAARAVGQAMGRNPLPIIIPCHRVLASGNKVGGFSSFGGTNTKQRLLALEGVRLDQAAPLLPGLLPDAR